MSSAPSKAAARPWLSSSSAFISAFSPLIVSPSESPALEASRLESLVLFLDVSISTVSPSLTSVTPSSYSP